MSSNREIPADVMRVTYSILDALDFGPEPADITTVAQVLMRDRARWIPVSEWPKEIPGEGYSADYLLRLYDEGRMLWFYMTGFVLWDEGTPAWVIYGVEYYENEADLVEMITHYSPDLPPVPTTDE